MGADLNPATASCGHQLIQRTQEQGYVTRDDTEALAQCYANDGRLSGEEFREATYLFNNAASPLIGDRINWEFKTQAFSRCAPQMPEGQLFTQVKKYHDFMIEHGRNYMITGTILGGGLGAIAGISLAKNLLVGSVVGGTVGGAAGMSIALSLFKNSHAAETGVALNDIEPN